MTVHVLELRHICRLTVSTPNSPTIFRAYSPLLPGHRKQTTVLNPFMGQKRHSAFPGVKLNHIVRLCGAQAVPCPPPFPGHTPFVSSREDCEGQKSTEAEGTVEKDKSFQAAFPWVSEEGVDPKSHVYLSMTLKGQQEFVGVQANRRYNATYSTGV